MNGQERATEVLAKHIAWPDLVNEVVGALHDAGLLAAAPPRIFQAGDPEPDDVRCVVNDRGVAWAKGDGWWHPAGPSGSRGHAWQAVLVTNGRLTEVHLPTGGAA